MPMKKEPRMTRKIAAGFTLIELMITVVIVGVLAAIALPAYQDQMRKGRRGAAQAHLMEIVAKEQAYLLDTRTGYSSSLSTLNLTTPADVSTYYAISIAVGAGPPPTFTVTAAPATGQDKDLGGSSLTVTNTGIKGPCVSASTGAYSTASSSTGCASGTTPVW
jgi:type IV pilus assembly protein PilE